MIKPIGNRLLIRCEKSNEKKIGEKTLITSVNDDKKGFYRFFVEECGQELYSHTAIVSDTGREVTMPPYPRFKKGQEIIIYDHTFMQMWPDCGDYRIINASDVYGVIE